MADQLARFYPNPDAFKLHVGALAKRKGHADIHEQLARLFAMQFDGMTLDRYFNQAVIL